VTATGATRVRRAGSRHAAALGAALGSIGLALVGRQMEALVSGAVTGPFVGALVLWPTAFAMRVRIDETAPAEAQPQVA